MDNDNTNECGQLVGSRKGPEFSQSEVLVELTDKIRVYIDELIVQFLCQRHYLVGQKSEERLL